LGETDEGIIERIEEIMKYAVENIDQFDIKLKGSGFFPNEKYIRVIWIGIENIDKTSSIAKKIDQQLSKLGFEKEKRGFSAHLTIARVKSAKNKDDLMKIIEKFRDIEFGTFNVNSIKLKKSELTPKGPIYTTLKEVKL
jgi:2'-5' RNA ligase